MLISLHLPKTAGLSLRASLEAHFGEGFRHDYADFPLNQGGAQSKVAAWDTGDALCVDDYQAVDCIHGHFLPIKYRQLESAFDCRYITWLREPVARLVSHYHYWLRSYDPESPATSDLHRQVVEEQWSLEAFCLSPQLRNVYSLFTWKFPLERFEFVGITEHFDDDLRYFSTQFLGEELPPQNINARDSGRCTGVDELPADLVQQILQFHSADHALYQQALSRRQERIALASVG